MSEVEITYSVLVDGEEIGFGTSGESRSIDEALDLIETAISRRQWECAAGAARDISSGSVDV